MNKMYNKTDNSESKVGHAVSLQDRHDASSRPGLLLRLGCAALALLLAVGGFSLLRSSFNMQLPVAHAEVHWDRTISTGLSDKEFDGEYPRVIELNVDTNTTMLIKDTAKINIGRDSGDNDASEIELYSGATLNLEGEITGTAQRVTVSGRNNAALNVFLNKGAVFDVAFDKEYSSDIGSYRQHSPITCYGCNYGCGNGGSVAATDANGNAIINSGAQSELTKNIFYIFNPGPVYTITATPDKEDSQVVWSKGPRGEILQTTQRTLEVTDYEGTNYNDTYTMLEVVKNGTENKVNIRLMENAKYQVYANFIPAPKWEWDDDNNAKLTISSYDRSSETGIREDVIYGNVTSTTVPPTGTEDGSVTYHATVNYNDEEYSDEKTVTIPSLGNHSNDYEFTDDSVWDWTKGSAVGMPVILVNTVGDDTQTYGKLLHVYVDGTENELTKKDKDHPDGQFRAASGSIDFMFQRDYLETLSVGEHDLIVELTDGTLSHKFTIHASGTNSGDDSGNSGDDSGNSGNDSGNSGDDSGNSGDDSGNSGDDSGNSGDDSGNSGDDSGNSGDDSGNSGDDSGNSGDDSGKDTGNTNTNTGKDTGNKDNSNDKGKGDWSPQTGDNHFRLFLAGWFFLASAGTIVMLLLQKKKKRYSHR